CNNANDGSVLIFVSHGAGPYGYQWTNVSSPNQANQSGLYPGVYSVDVQDQAGCHTGKVFLFTNPTVLTTSVSSTPATCSSNGTATANVSGGTSPYTYSWNGGGTSQSISGLAAANYTVSITDAHGCTSTGTINVASNPLTSTITPTNENCHGGSSGSVSLTVSGGTVPYTYAWNNSATTQNISNLSATTFSVLITDATGCANTKTVTVTEPAVLSTTVSSTNVTCNSLCNGTANANMSGGTAPYQYLWATTPLTQTTQSISGLCPGVYNLTVTDNKGCIVTSNATITEPVVLSVTVSATPATCGNNDGTATASVSGGTTQYSFLWTGGSTAQSPTGLAHGNYTLTVTDAKGCTAAGTTTVSSTTISTPICMVTVDSTSTHNEVIWAKPAVTNIDSVRIYRLVGATYTLIGEVSYSHLSEFVDLTPGINPNITSYRYEIQMVDHCGGVSALSAHHKTIHNTASISVSKQVNLIWDQYEGFSSSYYRIWRDSTINMSAPQLLDSVPWGNLNYTDLNPPTLANGVNYFIEVVTPGSCSISGKDPVINASNLNTSRSNVYRAADSTATAVNVIANGGNIFIAPNPNNGNFSVTVGRTSIVRMEVVDMLGSKVLTVDNAMLAQNGRYNIIMPYAKGVYILKIVTNSGIINKKFVIE
ncbi:MAG TPA: T9SS type A sorting domain-containing protein, partial [Bacteroidia bacterium]